MTNIQMQEAFEIELRQRDPNYDTKNKIDSREIFHYLTRAERDYVQEVYDLGIDKNEENKKKLGGLLLTATIDTITPNAFYPSSYSINLPADTLYIINERANTATESNIYVKPISFDEYSTSVSNPFRKARLDKYLRLQGLNSHIILTPNTTLTSVNIDYIKMPLGINLSQNCELNEFVHPLIVTKAVKLILAAKQEQVGYQIQSIEERNNK